MAYELTYLWRYNPITGFWDMVRDSLEENAKEWLAIWQADEPNAVFKVARKRPTKAPEYGKGSR